jgi:hypothetical protein
MSRISDPHFADRVRASFALQHAMTLIRAALAVVEHGRTEIHLPHWPVSSNNMASCMAAWSA